MSKRLTRVVIAALIFLALIFLYISKTDETLQVEIVEPSFLDGKDYPGLHDERITAFDVWLAVNEYYFDNGMYPESLTKLDGNPQAEEGVTYQQTKAGEGYQLCRQPGPGHTQCFNELDQGYPFAD